MTRSVQINPLNYSQIFAGNSSLSEVVLDDMPIIGSIVISVLFMNMMPMMIITIMALLPARFRRRYASAARTALRDAG